MKLKTLAIICLTSSLLFSACGSDSTDPKQIKTDAQDAGKIIYETSEFLIQLPQSWEIIEKDSYPSNVPAEIIVAFRSNIKNEIFTANLNIAKKKLGQKMITTRDFAKGSLATIQKSLIEFELLEDSAPTTGADEPAKYVFEFEGKKNPNESKIHFRQLYITNNGSGYTITASYLPTEDESVVNALKEMLNSFALQ